VCRSGCRSGRPRGGTWRRSGEGVGTECVLHASAFPPGCDAGRRGRPSPPSAHNGDRGTGRRVDVDRPVPTRPATRSTRVPRSQVKREVAIAPDPHPGHRSPRSSDDHGSRYRSGQAGRRTTGRLQRPVPASGRKAPGQQVRYGQKTLSRRPEELVEGVGLGIRTVGHVSPTLNPP